MVPPRVGSRGLAERPERRPDLPREELWLLPGDKVPAFVEPAVVDEPGIRSLGPASRGLIELVWEGAQGNWRFDSQWHEERELVFPVEPSRRDAGARQPVERDVVEDVVPRQPFGLAIEDSCDESVATCVVVQDPRGQPDG